MKVLHVYRTYFPDPPGGLQEAIRQICISTKLLGVENTIFTLSPNPAPAVIEFPEARVVRCRSWAAPASCDLGSPLAVRQFRELADEADVIHYLFPWPFGDLLHAMSPNKPSVLTYISDIVRQRWLGSVYAPLMWRTLQSMDAIVSNAPGYASSSPVLSTPSLQPLLHQIPLGIEESSYPKTGDAGVLRKLNLTPGEPFILFIGVLRYYKGLHTLLNACQHTSAKVVIAGSGPEEAALRAQAQQLNLQNVIFAGQITNAEKFTLLENCTAFALPSHLRSEAYGMVLVEASMMGKPMISCDIGTGTSFINMQEETGFVVPPEYPMAFAQAINHLVNDRALAQRYGLAARKRYEALFSGEALGKAYKTLFMSVAK